MFRLLCRELESALQSSGQSWTVFDEYQVAQANSQDVWKQYKNIGVLYVNGMTLRLLPKNKGLTGSMQLDMCLQVTPNTNVEETVSSAVTALLASHNGVVKEDSNNYSYSLNFNQPTSTGNVEITEWGDKFVRYSMTIAVSITNGIALGDGAYFKIKIGNEYKAVENIVTMTAVYNSNVDTRTMANTNRTKTSVDGQSWGLELVFALDTDASTNATQLLLLGNADDEPNAIYDVRYSFDGVNYKSKELCAHSINEIASRGDTVTVTCSFAEHADA